MVALPMGTASPGGAPTTPVVPLLPPPTEFSRFQKFFLSYLFYLILSPQEVWIVSFRFSNLEMVVIRRCKEGEASKERSCG